jgi:hypothetical protein
MPPVVRDEFGPSLPVLLRQRFGASERGVLLALAAVGAALVLAAVAVLVLRDDGTATLVHREAPQFTLLYREGVLEAVAPQAGELERLTARRGRLTTDVVVRPLRLPPYEGDASRGLLPSVAERMHTDLRASVPDFGFQEEGAARVNGAPGYQLAYQSREGDERTLAATCSCCPTTRAPTAAC